MRMRSAIQNNGPLHVTNQRVNGFLIVCCQDMERSMARRIVGIEIELLIQINLWDMIGAGNIRYRHPRAYRVYITRFCQLMLLLQAVKRLYGIHHCKPSGEQRNKQTDHAKSNLNPQCQCIIILPGECISATSSLCEAYQIFCVPSTCTHTYG